MTNPMNNPTIELHSPVPSDDRDATPNKACSAAGAAKTPSR